MIDIVPIADSGRVYVGRVAAVDSEGARLMVSLRLEPNTEDGRLVMSGDMAKEVAARLMAHAEASL